MSYGPTQTQYADVRLSRLIKLIILQAGWPGLNPWQMQDLHLSSSIQTISVAHLFPYPVGAE